MKHIYLICIIVLLQINANCQNYKIDAEIDGNWQTVSVINGNYQRKRIHKFNKMHLRKLRISVIETNGVPEARIFEIRCYA